MFACLVFYCISCLYFRVLLLCLFLVSFRSSCCVCLWCLLCLGRVCYGGFSVVYVLIMSVMVDYSDCLGRVCNCGLLCFVHVRNGGIFFFGNFLFFFSEVL